MTIAVDIGTDEFRSLRLEQGRLLGRRVAAWYIDLPATRAQQRLLDEAHVHYLVSDDRLLVLGDAAVDLAGTFHSPCMPLLPDGQLPTGDPVARQLCAAAIEAILPSASDESPSKGVLTYPRSRDAAVDFNQGTLWFVTRLLRLQGLEVEVTDLDFAATLAEFGQDQFTGLVLFADGEESGLSLAYRGHILARTSIARGSRTIDRETAKLRDLTVWSGGGEKYLDLAAAMRWRGELSESPSLDGTPADHPLKRICTELFADVFRKACEWQSDRQVQQVTTPLPLVCIGSLSRVPGITGLVREAMTMADFPLRVREIRTATSSRFAVARGALIHGVLEATPTEHERVA
ncbi:hypothetical protein Mal4_28260 [Maioricimonas rarisocia]|uniref:Competence protein A n=1 Tax=Maioricimonas rarisocia TaxID=2528026 RepID=A0A517Z7P9_9PLAN|nr:hypothetical protein [Maioricimonas rarisocia]QDU38498.1 hypothetical protein Mal4_28260 [Maioricimonas rarisocia]